MRVRIPKRLATAAAVACLAWAGVVMTLAPVASADPLGDIRGAVNGARGQSTCPPLNYSIELEGDAQAYAGNNLKGVPPSGRYKGAEKKYIQRADPAATGALVGSASATINDCAYKDFGVGFFRDEANEVSTTTIVFGKPPAPAAPPPVNCSDGSTVPAGQQCPVAAPKPDITCPAGSPTPTVPAGQTCAPIPDVTNAIQASFGDPGLTSVDFNVTNTSNLTATCNYTATANSLNPLVPKKTTRQFNVPANGTHTETFNGAPTVTTYNVTLSCHDASGKQKAELGHVQTSLLW